MSLPTVDLISTNDYLLLILALAVRLVDHYPACRGWPPQEKVLVVVWLVQWAGLPGRCGSWCRAWLGSASSCNYSNSLEAD